MSSNKDLLDLCKLNLMEETVVDFPAVDKDNTLAAINYKKRQLIIKIGPGKLVPNAMERHIENNQPDDFLTALERSDG